MKLHMDRASLIADPISYARAMDFITDVARKRESLKGGYPGKWNARKDAHRLGVIGEWGLAEMCGLSLDTSVKRRGDGGVDFLPYKVEVKASTYFYEPVLKLMPKDLEGPALYYVLMAIDEPEMLVRYAGFAIDELVHSCAYQHDFGNGPRTCLDWNQVIVGKLPPTIKAVF